MLASLLILEQKFSMAYTQIPLIINHVFEKIRKKHADKKIASELSCTTERYF